MTASTFTLPAIPPPLTERILSGQRLVQGWCTEEKAIDLAALIVQEKPYMVVELGVFGGSSLIPQAIALQHTGHGMIYGIDAWTKAAALEGMDPESEDDRKHIDWWSKVDLEGVRRQCSEAIGQLGLWEHVALIQAKASNCFELFPIHDIDILHIDGNHTEAQSTRDVAAWVPQVREDGWIWFDDCNWPSTQKAIAMMDTYASLVSEVVNEKAAYRLYRR